MTAPTLLFSKFGGVEQVIADAKEGLSQSEGIQLTSIEATSKGSQTTLQAELTFEDARKLGQTFKSFRSSPDSEEKSDEELLFGETDIGVQFPNITYTRKIDIRPLVPPEAKNPMTARLLANAQLRYLVHLPTPVKSSNSDQVSNNGKTLTWEVPVTDLLAGPVEMNLTAPIPRLGYYLTLAGVFLLFLLITLYSLRKLLPKQATTSP